MFGRHIIDRSHYHAFRRFALFGGGIFRIDKGFLLLDELRQTEIEIFHVTVGTTNDVAVNDMRRVRGAQSIGDLNRNIQNFRQVHRRLIENFAQGRAFDKLADDILHSFRFADFVNN